MSLLKKYRSLILMTLLIGWYFFYTLSNQFFIPPGHLKITMLNIGQGDAILIQIAETRFRTTDILVDAGPDYSIIYELGDVLPPWNKTIEYAMVSHEHVDHVAGFFEFEGRYAVEQWLLSGHAQDSEASVVFHEAMERLGGEQQRVRRGDIIQLTTEAAVQIIHPTATTHDDANEDSIVARFQFKNFSMMLTGDAYTEQENEIVQLSANQPELLNVDILKAGHHGSKTSTSPEWLQATQPEVVFISAGVNNTFGHPHYRVMKSIQDFGATEFQSNRDGRVACESDGETCICAPVRSPALQLLSLFGFESK